MKLLAHLLVIAIVLSSCMVFHVKPVGPFDERLVEKVAVPRKFRMSGLAEEEDLTPLCKGRPLVYVKFVLNVPTEVWCQLPEAPKVSGDRSPGPASPAHAPGT